MTLTLANPQTVPSPAASATGAARADAWTVLRAELDAWAAAGLTARWWWRDDDAVDATPELDRLLGLSAHTAVPVALAVVPAGATPALATVAAGVGILQHGWDHRNHAPAGTKKAELGADRPTETVLARLAEGRSRLRALFGAAALPVLVPPWNRIAPAVAAGLPATGFRGLSTFAGQRLAVPGLTEANTHIDPVDWHHGRGFLGETAVLSAATGRLRQLRTDGVAPEDANAANGLLTHHLAMDEATWDFVARFLAETVAHPAVRWLPADTLFGGGATP